MTAPTLTNAELGPPSQAPDPRTEGLPNHNLKSAGETQSRVEKEAAESERTKPSARDILNALVEKRISIIEINFLESISQDHGGNADVVEAILSRKGVGERGPRKVAVKKFRLIINDEMTAAKFLRIFTNELRVLAKLSHPNIAKIIGFVEDIGNRIAWLVFPWETNGNLREFLRSGERSTAERISLIIDTATGLEYLHTREPPICHGDLKSLNILVNANHCALIIDFGSARIIKKIDDQTLDLPLHSAASGINNSPRYPEGSQITISVSNATLTLTGPVGTLRWTAPEILCGEEAGLASDVWALGWIIWEAITGRYPFEEINAVGVINLMIIEGQLPLPSTHDQLLQLQHLHGIMRSCWNFVPQKRPSAAQCRASLSWMPTPTSSLQQVQKAGIWSTYALRWIAAMHYRQARTGPKKLIAADRIHQMQSQDAVAQGFLGQAQELYALLGNGTAWTNHLQCLRDLHMWFLRKFQAESAYTQALEIYNHSQTKHSQAEKAYTLALEIYSHFRAGWSQASALQRLGDLYQLQQEYAKAKNAYTRALDIYTRLGDDQGQANTLLRLGDLYQWRSRHVEEGWIVWHVVKDLTWQELRGLLTKLHGRQLENIKPNNRPLDILPYILVTISWERASDLLLRLYSCFSDEIYGFDGEASKFLSLDLRIGVVKWLRGLHRQHSKHGPYCAGPGKLLAEELDTCAFYANVLAWWNGLQGHRDVHDWSSKNLNLEKASIQALKNCTSISNDFLDLAKAIYRHKAEGAYVQALEIYACLGNDRGRVKTLLGLANIQALQGQYAEAKVTINDAAEVSEILNYHWGRQTSKTLLKEILEVENSPTTNNLLSCTDLPSTDSASCPRLVTGWSLPRWHAYVFAKLSEAESPSTSNISFKFHHVIAIAFASMFLALCARFFRLPSVINYL